MKKIQGNILKKLGQVHLNGLLERVYNPLNLKAKLFHSRNLAKKMTRKARKELGRKVVTPALHRQIKEYAREYFGSSSYWPWLVYFTEVRGSFHEGWIPSDFYVHHLSKKLNPEMVSHLSFCKSFDHRLFGTFSIPPLMFRTHGMFYDADCRIMDTGQAVNLIRQIPGEVVIKKEQGKKGRGILFIDSKEVNPELLLAHDEYLIQEAVEQHPYMNALNPASINTVRITTFLEHDGNISVKYSGVRIGGAGKRTDNVSTGGFFVFVNDEGEALAGACSETGVELYDRHPVTGFQFRELRLPWYKKAVEQCRQSHRSYPYVRCVGWDVFFDLEGRPRLLEWNGRLPGYRLAEMYIGPLWELDEVRAMIDQYGLH